MQERPEESPRREAARTLLAASGGHPDDLPEWRRGEVWFRHFPDYRITTLAAALVTEAARHGDGLRVELALAEAAELLAADDDEVVHLVEVAFVEALVCLCSHEDPAVAQAVLEVCPAPVWSVWHRRRERLEALAERPPRVSPARLAQLDDTDELSRALARGSTYRAENGAVLAMADLVSADAPSPWVLRHPVLTGCVFGAVMLVLFLLSLRYGFGRDLLDQQNQLDQQNRLDP